MVAESLSANTETHSFDNAEHDASHKLEVFLQALAAR
jgi:hypothetical protein